MAKITLPISKLLFLKKFNELQFYNSFGYKKQVVFYYDFIIENQTLYFTNKYSLIQIPKCFDFLENEENNFQLQDGKYIIKKVIEKKTNKILVEADYLDKFHNCSSIINQLLSNLDTYSLFEYPLFENINFSLHYQSLSFQFSFIFPMLIKKTKKDISYTIFAPFIILLNNICKNLKLYSGFEVYYHKQNLSIGFINKFQLDFIGILRPFI